MVTMKVFIICPVRHLEKKEKKKIMEHIKRLEDQGHQVHYPSRNTNQDDPIGYNICLQNTQAIIDADEVHIYWNSKSKGSLFDLGMAFIIDKTIRLINEVKTTEHKSFENVLLKLNSISKGRV